MWYVKNRYCVNFVVSFFDLVIFYVRTLVKVEEPAIIHLLQRRFHRDEIWTSVGDILIAVNPFKRTNHFTPTEIQTYRGRGTKVLPPHPYTVIDDAYNDMINKKTNQSILISGESGAGKTYTVRVCMDYVSQVAGSPNGVEKKVSSTYFFCWVVANKASIHTFVWHINGDCLYVQGHGHQSCVGVIRKRKNSAKR